MPEHSQNELLVINQLQSVDITVERVGIDCESFSDFLNILMVIANIVAFRRNFA
jgi:hypothetical protein